MTISARAESPPADEDDGPGVRGWHLDELPDPALDPPVGTNAQDLPMVGEMQGGAARRRKEKQQPNGLIDVCCVRLFTMWTTIALY